MAQTQSQQLQQLETEAIAIWNFLVNSASTPAQLERLYLKVLVYLVGYFLNQATAIVATAKPGIIGGSITAYRNRVLAISADIADVGITNPTGNNVVLNLLAITGQPSVTLLNLVQSTMQLDSNRMVCDTISVQPAVAQNYAITATIFLIATASESDTLTKANAALATYRNSKQTQLGADIIRTDIINILRDFIEIGDVSLTDPATNLAIPPQNYGNCTSLTVVSGGRMSA